MSETVTIEQMHEQNRMEQLAQLETLAEQARQGDMQALGEVYKRTHAHIFGLMLQRTGDPERAADLTQDAYERAIKYIGSSEQGSIIGWLRTIAKNRHIDEARRDMRVKFEPLADDRAAVMAAKTDIETESIEHLDPNALYILQHIENDDFREAVRLVVIGGLTYEEAAHALGIKIGTLRSRLHRGIGELKKRVTHRDQIIFAAELAD